MHLHVQHWISQYGYFGVFFILFTEALGIPFPTETALTVSGFEWMKGAFSLVPLLLCAALGNIIGSTIAYSIGYFLGRPVIVRFGRYVGITEQRLNAADVKFSKYRTRILLFSKFIAGIRVLVPYLAGINRMPFALFTAYNAVSAVVWAAVFILLGRYAGVAWSHHHKVLHHYLVPAIIVALVVVGIVFVRKIIAKRKPEADSTVLTN
jgi:membrane protein DedA with SNARE-associated domain